MQQGVDSWKATDAKIGGPYFLSMLADAYEACGHNKEALSWVVEALTLVKQTKERWWEAELHRKKGELLLAGQRISQNGKRQNHCLVAARECFEQALTIARQQQAKSLELRAAMSLVRLQQHIDPQHNKCDTVAEIYQWFEDHVAPETIVAVRELQEAKALLFTSAWSWGHDGKRKETLSSKIL